MDFQKQIQDMIEKRAQELVEAKLQLIFQSVTSGSSTKKRRAVKNTSLNTPNPRGALKKAVLAAMTNSPLTTGEIVARVKSVSPGFNNVQIANVLSQLAGSKVCSRTGKRHSYKYCIKK